MRKILITHISNTLNYGSAMMAINLMYYMNKKSKEPIEFYCDVENDFHLDRIRKETDMNNIYRFNFVSSKWKSKNKISKAIKLFFGNILVINRITTDFDQLIVLGGDDFSEYYNVKFYVTLYKIFLIKQLHSIAKKIPVILYGQTIGPYTSWRKAIVKQLFKRLIVITRDTINYTYLTENYIFKDYSDSRDLAFLNLPKQRKRHYILEEYNLKPEKYICIVVSGLQYQYCESEETYIKNWEMIIQEILKKYPNKYIVLLSHVFCKNSSDSSMIEKINITNNNIKITDILLPSEARTILGNAYLTITGRMHAALSTFQMGKPAISLSYSVKYKGVISDGLDLSDLVIEKDKEMWDKFRVSSIINDKIEYIDENYIELKSKILKNVNSSKSMIEESITGLVKDIKIR